MGDESSSDHNHKHTAARRKQVKLACTNCRKAHAACDDVRPCTRCTKYNLEDSCEDKARRKRATGAPKRSHDEVTPAPLASAKSEQLAPPAIRRRTSTPDELYANPLTIASPPLGTGEFEFDPIASSSEMIKKEGFAQFANAQRFGQDFFETMPGGSYGSYMYVQSPTGELMLASSPGGPVPGMMPQAAQGRLLQRPPGVMHPHPHIAAAAAAQMQQMQQMQQLQQLGSPNGVPQIPQSPYPYAFLPPAAPLPTTPQGSTASPATPNSGGWELTPTTAGDPNSAIPAGYPMPYQSPYSQQLPASFPSSPVPMQASYSMPGSGTSSPFPLTPNTPNQSSTSSSSNEVPIPDQCGPSAVVPAGTKPPSLEEAQTASSTAMALWRMSDRKLVEWNAAFRTLFGYSEDQMKALTCIRLFPSKELSRGVLGVLAQECSRAVVMRSSVHRQLLFSKANGQEFLAEITCTPQFNYAGDFSGHCLMTLSERHALVPPPTMPPDQQAAAAPQPAPVTPNIQSLQSAVVPMQPHQPSSTSPQSGRRNSVSMASTGATTSPNMPRLNGAPSIGQGATTAHNSGSVLNPETALGKEPML